MQLHKIITPDFFNRFQCVGPECLILCCRGWAVIIDEKTHKKYISSSHPGISKIAKENLILRNKGEGDYSIIKMNEKGECPFLNQNKLCMVHQDLGESALSYTCSSYPRLRNCFDDQTRHIMSLSCPEVVRLVLFEPDAMVLQQQERELTKYETHLVEQRPSVTQAEKVVHLFAWNLIKSPAVKIEENLMALTQFILYLQSINFDLQSHLTDVENVYEALLAELQGGISLLGPGNLTRTNAIRYLALSAMGKFFANKNVRDSFIINEHQTVIEYLGYTNQTDPTELDAKFDKINQQWQMLCRESCLSEPWVLRNYLLYKLYSTYFPANNMATIMHQLYRIVLDFFYVKTVLSVKSMQEDIDQKAVMKTLASFSAYMMHDKKINDRMDNAIDIINSDDKFSCLLLIG